MTTTTETAGSGSTTTSPAPWLPVAAGAVTLVMWASAFVVIRHVAHDVSPGGYLWATRQPRITTGLALGPDSATDDFHYYRPHLGATAWAALAALGWNPFTGRRLA